MPDDYDERSTADSIERVAALMSSGPLAPPKRCDVALANLGWYQLYFNLYRGGRYIFNPPQGTKHPVTGEEIFTYLERHEAEPDDEFTDRHRQSFFLPYPREIVTIYTSTLFRQDVVRDAISTIFGSEYVANVDLLGSSAREFLRRAFTLAQIGGWVGVLTDYPATSGAFLSRWHEQQAGNRPYSRVVLPTRLWDWVRDPGTGQFTYAEIWNGEHGKYDAEHERGGVWRRWYPDSWVDVDEDGEVLDAGTHTFGRVPLDILVCQSVEADDGLAPFGQSALVDVANVALHMYQVCSLLESHERRALFAFLHIGNDPQDFRGDSKPVAPDLHLGNAHYLWSPGDVGWVEPPSSVPEEAREHIGWCIQEMRRAAGVATRSEESVEAHSGVALAWEYSSRHNAVYERAQHLEDFESRWWQTHGEWLGQKVPPDSIRYPREYAIQPIEQELSEIERITAIADQWGVQDALAPYVKLKLRRIEIRDAGHHPEIDDVLEALDAMDKQSDASDESQPMDTSDGESLPEKTEQELLNEAVDNKLNVIEKMTKAKFPDEVIRVVGKRILDDLQITDPAAIAALNVAEFRWYTEEVLPPEEAGGQPTPPQTGQGEETNVQTQD